MDGSVKKSEIFPDPRADGMKKKLFNVPWYPLRGFYLEADSFLAIFLVQILRSPIVVTASGPGEYPKYLFHWCR